MFSTYISDEGILVIILNNIAKLLSLYFLFQVGTAAWGDKTCQGNQSDVFADVSKALGFIEWAIKCDKGQDVDLYEKFTFGRWAKRQYCKKVAQIRGINNMVCYRIIKYLSYRPYYYLYP